MASVYCCQVYCEESLVLKDTISVFPVLSLTLGDLGMILLSGPQSREVPVIQKRLEDLGSDLAFREILSTTWVGQPLSRVLSSPQSCSEVHLKLKPACELRAASLRWRWLQVSS